jgi:hypothetical protein
MLLSYSTPSVGTDDPNDQPSAGNVTVAGQVPPLVTEICALLKNVAAVPLSPAITAQDDVQLVVKATYIRCGAVNVPPPPVQLKVRGPVEGANVVPAADPVCTAKVPVPPAFPVYKQRS